MNNLKEEVNLVVLGSKYNKFVILSSKVMKNISRYNLIKDTLRKVTVNIGLEGIIVKMLLDGGTMGLVISSEFTRKQRFNF